MLRASLRSSRAIGYRSSGISFGRQWHGIEGRAAASDGVRGYADKASISDSKPIVLPGSVSSSTNEPLPVGRVATSSSANENRPTPASPSSTSTIPPHNVPRTPPTPSEVNATSPPSSTTPPLPPPKKPRKFFRRFFTSIFLITAIGFGGGIYYSRVNDNFHDFFTEYVPFGEDAVLYFEEKEFRKRFPSIANRKQGKPRDTGDQIRIPSQSGVSWRVAEDNATARHANASKPEEALQSPKDSKPSDKVKVAENAKQGSEAIPSKPQPTAVGKSPDPVPPAKPGHPVSKEAAPKPAEKVEPPKPTAASFTAPEVNEPSRFPPEVTRIDPVNVKDAEEPLVQDLVKIINDIIAVVNADNANSKFSTTISKAKSEIANVGGKIKALKEKAEKEASSKVEATHSEFDRAAKELIRRVEGEMQQQEAQWKEEYETERQKLHKSYEEKLKAEVQRANEVNEQRLRNKLLEQAVGMKRKFISDIKDRVEEERDSRLGKLTDLSKTVNELEKLTSDWNSVVDANLKTQHLHVAVEAVRSNLEKSQLPLPFTRELAALKEIASDDPVVNAAVASINPSAYQRGVPSSAQLIDRFRRVASEVRKASLLPEDAGVASHASSWVLSKLLFKKKGLATGDDVESILTRTEVLLEEGDLDAAAREMNGLNGWAKTLSRDWLGEVRKVLEVQQALDVIATEARLQSLRVE